MIQPINDFQPIKFYPLPIKLTGNTQQPIIKVMNNNEIITL